MSSPSPSLTRLAALLQQLQNTPNCLTFETVELPFQLAIASWQVWVETFSPESLTHLADTDPNTLDAWGVALHETLKQQVDLLQPIISSLTNLPIPSRLTQKISYQQASLLNLSQQKQTLLAANHTLLQQEAALRQQQAEWQALKQKTQELAQIQQTIATVDWVGMQQAITTQQASLEPQQAQLQALQQQQQDLTAQIEMLQQQQHFLQQQVAALQSAKTLQEQQTLLDSDRLLSLTTAYHASLSETLIQQQQQLLEQEQAYRQLWQQWQTALERSQAYHQEIISLRQQLQTHFQANQSLTEYLPIEQAAIAALQQTIQHNFNQWDQILADAKRIQAELQQKKILFF